MQPTEVNDRLSWTRSVSPVHGIQVKPVAAALLQQPAAAAASARAQQTWNCF